MKQILSMLALAVLLTSCASNGKSAENIEEKESVETEIKDSSNFSEDKKDTNTEKIDKKQASIEDKPSLDMDKDVKVDKDSIFYIPHLYLVQFDRNDNLVDLDGNTKFENGSMLYGQVPGTNSLYVGRSYDRNEYGIYNLVGKSLNLLYRFAKNEEFYPVGMIGNKIYGYHYISILDENGNLADRKRTIGYFDLEERLLKDYYGKHSHSITSVASNSDKVYFVNNESGKNCLYSFSPESDLSDDPELVEKDFNSYDVYATSFIEGGQVINDYFKSEEDGIHIGDQRWKVPVNSEGFVQINGRFIFYYTKSTRENPSDYEQNLKIYDAYSGDLVFDENIMGQNYTQNTFYYIDENNDLKEFEIDF